MKRVYFLPYIFILIVFSASSKNTQAQIIHTVAGNGVSAYSGDGGDALGASLVNPVASCDDGDGNIYLIDGNAIRKIDANGNINTLFGSATAGFTPDGFMNSSSLLNTPSDIEFYNGKIYIVEGNRVRRIGQTNPATAFTITTVVGTGVAGFGGDGSLAINAMLNNPHDICFSSGGYFMYIADAFNHRVRAVDMTTNVITTVAGNGIQGMSNTNGLAINSPLNYPLSVLYNNDKVYFADAGNHRIMFVNLSSFNPSVDSNGIRVVANISGIAGNTGDGADQQLAKLNHPNRLALSEGGDIYVSDNGNHNVRILSAVADGYGIIGTVAGNGVSGYTTNGSNSIGSQLNDPFCVHVFNKGHIPVNSQLLICDKGNFRLRKMTMPYIKRIAGTTQSGFNGDNIPAINAQINSPTSISHDVFGNSYFIDEANFRIRKIDSAGIITTIAGNGISPTSFTDTIANGSIAMNTAIHPKRMCLDNNGNIYFSNSENHKIYKLSTSGIISTYAGMNSGGNINDTGLAIYADLSGQPKGLYMDNTNNLYFFSGYKIRKIDTGGYLSTVAGTGLQGFNGDGGQATLAQINDITGMRKDIAGNLLIADKGNNRVRKIDVNTNIINTVAGNGNYGSTNDIALDFVDPIFNNITPIDLGFDMQGNLYIADEFLKIRKINTNPPILTTISGYGYVGYLLNSITGAVAPTGIAAYYPMGEEFVQLNSMDVHVNGDILFSNILFNDTTQNFYSFINKIYYPNIFYDFPNHIVHYLPQGSCTSGAVNYNIQSNGILSYHYSGATTGSGSGTGSGSLFNVGVTTVTITANQVGLPNLTKSFTITVKSYAEINVYGNLSDITSGDMQPDTLDKTDMGLTYVGNSTSAQYVIQNQSPNPLTITNINITGPDSNDFILDPVPSVFTINGNSTYILDVNVFLNNTTPKNATIEITSNDCDESLYTFAIRAQGTYAKTTALEYYFDTDPGIGLATSIPVPIPLDTVVLSNFSIPTIALPEGVHTITIRAKNEYNVWSALDARVFYIEPSTPDIIALEYFVDTDPGFGNGVSIPVSSPTPAIALSSLNLNNIASEGIHSLSIRAKNSFGVWSVVESSRYLSYGVPASQITALEFFVDTDPGIGLATPLAFTGGNTGNITVTQLPLLCLSNGAHYISIRAKNNLEVWSVMDYDTVIINNPLINTYNVTGGGSICPNDTIGIEIGLDGSQIGIAYQLQINGTNIGIEIIGTGNPISFGYQNQAGTYTILANGNYGCFNAMNGNAMITYFTLPLVFNVTGGGSYCETGNGVTVELSGSEPGVTYQLKVNNSNIGSPLSGTGSAISFGNQTQAGEYTVEATNNITGCSLAMNLSAIINITLAITPSISISTNPGNFVLNGTTVVFTANVTGGGTNPTYQWYKHLIPVGNGSSSFSFTSNTSGVAIIKCVLTSNEACVTTSMDTSNIQVVYWNDCVNTTSILYVDSSVTISGNGLSWATAYKTLAEALYIANKCIGDTIKEIHVAKGTYFPINKPFSNGSEITTNDNRDKTFCITKNLSLYGGYPSGGGTRDFVNNPTVLSGDFNEDDIISGIGANLSIANNGENAYHVVLGNPISTQISIDGFTIKGGNANGNNSVVLSYGIIFNSSGGAGICMEGFGSAALNLQNNIIFGNQSYGYGAGIYYSNIIANIEKNIFSHNIALNTIAKGAGLYAEESNSKVINNLFFNNQASDGGAACFYTAGVFDSTYVANNTFIKNRQAMHIYGPYCCGKEAVNNVFYQNTSNPEDLITAWPRADFKPSFFTSCNFYNNFMQHNQSAYQSNNQYNILGSLSSGNYFAVNPQFLDENNPAGADGIFKTADDGFRLMSNSPALDVGITGINVPNFDILNSTRVGNPDCGAYEGGVIVNLNIDLLLKAYIQGYYIGSGYMNTALLNQGGQNTTTQSDSITIELHNPSAPYITEFSYIGILDTNGTISASFPASAHNNAYYVVVKHRNSLETWSANPVTLSAVTNYDFSTAANKAYGDNQIEVETDVFAIYSGDIDQNGYLELDDYNLWDIEYQAGYPHNDYTPDLDGNGYVELDDYNIWDANYQNGVYTVKP